MKNNSLYSQLNSFSSLVSRNILVFLKDKMMVLFSFLAPFILLMLYVLFLGDIQVDSIKAMFKSIEEEYHIVLGVEDKMIKSFVNCWLIAGVSAVSSITVAIGTLNLFVEDRQNGVTNDFISSPTKASVITLSYAMSSFIITAIIVLLMLACGLIYLGATNAFYLTVGEVFELLGVTILSSLSATTFMIIVARFIKTSNAYGAFTGIISALLGFLIGAYMPISMFPKGLQIFANILPGSHSAGIFRNIMLDGVLKELTNGMPSNIVDSIKDAYSFELNFFGTNVGTDVMYIYLAVSVVVFIAINVIISRFSSKNK